MIQISNSVLDRNRKTDTRRTRGAKVSNGDMSRRADMSANGRKDSMTEIMQRIGKRWRGWLDGMVGHHVELPTRPICIACKQPYAKPGNSHQDEEGWLNWPDFVCRKCYNAGKRQLSPDVVIPNAQAEL